MKRFFLSFVCLGVVTAVHLNAQQKCSYAKAYQTNTRAFVSSEATKAATLDASIEQNINPNTGEVSYVRKMVTANTGEVSSIPVEYCTRSKRFVDVSRASTTSCSKTKAAYSSTQVYQLSSPNTKEAAVTTAQKAACAAACSKTKSVKTVPAGNTKVKLVKVKN